MWGYDPKDKGGFKVVCYTGDLSQLYITPLPDALDDFLQFKPCKITFVLENSYPGDICDFKDVFGISDKDKWDEFSNLYYNHISKGSINKLLGYPDLIQGDIFLESQLVTNGLYCGDPTGYNDPRRKELEKGISDWILLFQIDSDDNADMMWGDVGRIYFVIKKDDLNNLIFDKIWSSFQCC